MKCEGCGECCGHLGFPPFLPDPFPVTLPESLIQELLTARKKMDRSAALLPCLWLNLETKRCKHYHFRPDVCQDFLCPGGEPSDPADDRTPAANQLPLWPMQQAAGHSGADGMSRPIAETDAMTELPNLERLALAAHRRG